VSPSSHSEVADALRSKINSGELADELPSIQQLGDDFGVGRATVRRALQTLTAEGLIEGGAGQLKHVRREDRDQWVMSTLAAKRTADEDTWTAMIHQRGQTPSVETTVHLLQADAELVAALEIGHGDQVVLQAAVHKADGKPHHLTDVHLPQWIVAAHPEFVTAQDPATHAALLAAAKLPQAYYDDGIAGRMPTPDESQRLRISPGVPLLIHTRITYSADDRPLRYIRTRVAADRAAFAYQVEA